MGEVSLIDVTDAPSEPKPKVMLYVATPCYGCMVSIIYMLSLLRLQAECSQRGIECVVDMIGNESLVPRARNILTARFLKSKATHLLFIDADIGFRPDTVFRLLEANKHVATAVYPKKAYDWEMVQAKLATKDDEPVHMMGLDYNINLIDGKGKIENGFVQVLDAATGFMLIRRDVLVKMNEKYKDTLLCVNDLPGNRDSPEFVTEYVALFDCMIDPANKRYLSEDYAFDRRAQETGFEIWADVASPLCHAGTYLFEGDLRQRFSLVFTG